MRRRAHPLRPRHQRAGSPACGAILDQGRAKRLFTRAQRRRLWRRDRRCTYPGCTAPGAWARAHHVWHWVDGGPSDLGNAALLCEAHHTLVHQRRLWADVRKKQDDHGRHVIWDLTPGSYDRALEQITGGDPPGPDHQHQPERECEGQREREQRRRDALTTILDLPALRAALEEHDERALADWYDRPIEQICPDAA